MEDVLEKREGFKKTKVGWIPDDWGYVELREVCEIFGRIGYRGYTIKDIVQKGEGAISLSPSNISGNCIDFENSTYISWQKYEESPEIILESNDIVLVKTGSTYGKSALVKSLSRKATINPQIVIIKNVTCVVSYLAQLISHEIVQVQIHKTVVGGAIPTLSQENILKFLIPLPSTKEQKKISQILSTWDEAISNTQSLIDQLKLRKKGLMQQLFTGKKRLDGYTERWKRIQIGKIAEQYSVKNKENEEITVLSCTKYDGLVPSLEYFGRKVYGDDISKYKVVPKGYFAYATNHIEEGSIGLQTEFDKGLVSPMYTVFKTAVSIDDSFMFRLLKTERMIYMYQSNMSGSIARRGGLRWNDFKTIEVIIPELLEQVAISDFFDAVDAEIQSRENHLNELLSQKKGLMQQLLTGQKRVNL